MNPTNKDNKSLHDIPVNLFRRKFNISSEDKLEIVTGIFPESLLSPKFKSCKYSSFPTSTGIVPSMKLLLQSKISNLTSRAKNIHMLIDSSPLSSTHRCSKQGHKLIDRSHIGRINAGSRKKIPLAQLRHTDVKRWLVVPDGRAQGVCCFFS